MSRRTNRSAIAKLDAIYATLPTVACRGLCAVACGPIPMSTLEAERLRKADRARRAVAIRNDLTCIYLTPANRCGVYPVRPLICRIWGCVKRMSCMHGCIPDRWMSDHEFVEVAQRIERIGGPIVVSALTGVERRGDSFLDLDTSRVSTDEAERLAEHTRVLRALHGGRIVGVVPSTEPTWIDLDARRSAKQQDCREPDQPAQDDRANEDP
jgi:Fe-S-cluster containining protein